MRFVLGTQEAEGVASRVCQDHHKIEQELGRSEARTLGPCTDARWRPGRPSVSLTISHSVSSYLGLRCVSALSFVLMMPSDANYMWRAFTCYHA